MEKFTITVKLCIIHTKKYYRLKLIFLYDCDDIEVYKIAYEAFAYFYKYSFCLYKTHNNDHINNPSFLEHNDNNYLYMRNYTKIHSIGKNAYQGKGVVLFFDKKSAL
ncbi:hypothetical protein NEIG_01614 [Nematocida sp. ERTm5]|nr:hypothetical protein NEIG_01614 [Nematocida sp. ERTm5]